MEHRTARPPPIRIGKRDFRWSEKTFVMGVLNATPDSFSGDGLGADVDRALRRALAFEEQGADIVDVGGESTRPPSLYAGSEPVTEQEELTRVMPVIEALAPALSIPISIDTSKARVAARALAAGAAMVNDTRGLRGDADMAAVVAGAGVPVVLMHNQDHTRYADLVPDVIAGLRKLADDAVAAGVEEGKIILDPGMGFGKTVLHNLEIIRRLDEFSVLGMPLLVGMSRKSTIGRVLGVPVDDRVEGTAATVALSIANGADIVRVHDVKEMVRVARMSDAIVRGWKE